MNEKCIKCNYCEPDGIGLSGEAECMKYKEECNSAIIFCKEYNLYERYL